MHCASQLFSIPVISSPAALGTTVTVLKRLYRGDLCRVPYISLVPLISLRTANCSPKFKRANESKVPANYCYFTMLALLLGQKTFQRTFKIPSFECIECVCHKSRRMILKAFQPHLGYLKTFFSQVWMSWNSQLAERCRLFILPGC